MPESSLRANRAQPEEAADPSLTGMVVGVLGCSRGFGFAIAQAAQRAGAWLAFIARPSRELQRA
jgi:NAD(P)-dependent dehydrogenase (short-subunit alcohol dehydrogenase family)